MTRLLDQTDFVQMVEDFLDDFDAGDRGEFFLEGSWEVQALLRFLHSTKAGLCLLLAAAPDHPAAAILRRGEILAHDLESATSALTEEKNGDRGPQEKRLREGLAALRRLVEEVRSLARSADLRAPELPEEASGKSAAAGPASAGAGSVVALLVRVDGVPCLFPLEHVEAVVRLPAPPQGVVLFRGDLLPFVLARRIWNFAPKEARADAWSSGAAVVVQSSGGRGVLGVDRWERRGAFLTRAVPEGFRFGGVERVAFLTGGEVALVLAMPERWP